MEKIVAIILNYNTSKDCEKCLSYILKQDYENISVVIVDNASTNSDEKDRLISLQQKYKFKLLFSERNDGFSAGNNIGLKWAKRTEASWALIINPDVELRDSHYISYVMSEKRKWDEAVVIGTDVRLPSGERQNPQRESTYWEEVLWPMSACKGKFLKIRNIYLCEDTTGYCEKVTGACFFIDLRFVDSIGYLDQHVFMYSEEAILAAQVKKAKAKELYISEVRANHEHYSKQKSPSLDRMRMFDKSRTYYIDNYTSYGKFATNILKLSRKLQNLALGWKIK